MTEELQRTSPEPGHPALAALRTERDQLQILVDVTNAVLSTLDIGDLVDEVAEVMYRFFGTGYVGLDLLDGDSGAISAHGVFPRLAGQARRHHDRFTPDNAATRDALSGRKALVGEQDTLQRLAHAHPRFARITAARQQAVCMLPLVSPTRTLGTLLLAHPDEDHPFGSSLALLQQVAARITLALDNALAYQEITRLKDRLARENLVLSEEIRHYENFDEIIGASSVMSAVLEQVEMVAGSDCSVLILGETGTGKELIARAIHKLSPRAGARMVTMNCAAIPAGLLESDLFGHEKGAFTGATAARAGRFEMADHGTLFLDEVGDIPLELQPKLLRVLQEREVERLGGSRITPVDVRVISATSCDLQQMIADKAYRSDLYYRLNVFPIIVPPLRDRPEDIPLLARFFTRKFARRMNRPIEHIAAETLDRLAGHSWPGNVRELQNVIERAVILSRGPVLALPPHDLQYAAPVPARTPSEPARPARGTPLFDDSESERERILRVLKETNGIVAGPRGAAARLGLKRTTLLSRMQRLGISGRQDPDS